MSCSTLSGDHEEMPARPSSRLHAGLLILVMVAAVLSACRPAGSVSAPPPTPTRITRNGIPLLTASDIKALVDQHADAEFAARSEFVIIDVRTDLAYAAGHVPGAVHFPEDQAETRYTELPRDKPIVAY